MDVPDRLLRLFVRVAVHNGGQISRSKRSKVDMLTDEEIKAMEEVVQRHLPRLSAAADVVARLHVRSEASESAGRFRAILGRGCTEQWLTTTTK